VLLAVAQPSADIRHSCAGKKAGSVYHSGFEPASSSQAAGNHHQEHHMQHLKWLAVPLALLGLVFLFFGLIWQGAVQLGVAVALLALAAAAWRISTGTWTLTNDSTPGM
jgi:hypothetical protein